MRRRDLFFVLGSAIALGARRSRAAEGDAGDRLPQRLVARTVCIELAAFRQGLSEAGYVEGQNVAIEYRWAEGHYDRLPALAADLVGRKVDVIVAKAASSGTCGEKCDLDDPDRLLAGSDPVARRPRRQSSPGRAAISRAYPFHRRADAKRLELLSELVPEARVIALLVNPNFADPSDIIRTVQEAARAKGLQLRILKAATESEIDAAFASLVQLHAGALLVGPTHPFLSRREQIVALAARTCDSGDL